MVTYSIIAYVIIVGWWIFGSNINRFVISIIGTCLSGFLAFGYRDISKVAMIIYFVMGVLCVFLHWVSIDMIKKSTMKKKRNKTITAILSLFFGICGVHKFYLKRSASGLLYILFSWTFIPAIIGVVEAICFFAMKQENFDALYNDAVVQGELESINVGVEDNTCQCTNQRNGDNLNYKDIKVGGYDADVIGPIEDFSITMKLRGNTYIFKVKDGDVCAYRSSNMRETKCYEVT